MTEVAVAVTRERERMEQVRGGEARLGFKLRRVRFDGRRGASCTPVQPWKLQDAEDFGSSSPPRGTGAGAGGIPTCSKQRSRRRAGAASGDLEEKPAILFETRARGKQPAGREKVKEEALRSVIDELREERSRRRRSESLRRNLAGEFSDLEAAYSALADLCDELAEGIRKYEQQARELRRRLPGESPAGRCRRIGLVLHISESWLNARSQMRFAEARGDLARRSLIHGRLAGEIEDFLRSCRSNRRRSVSSVLFTGAVNDDGDDDDSLAGESYQGRSYDHGEATQTRNVATRFRSAGIRRDFAVAGEDGGGPSNRPSPLRRRRPDAVEEEDTLAARLYEAKMDERQGRLVPGRLSSSRTCIPSPLGENYPANLSL